MFFAHKFERRSINRLSSPLSVMMGALVMMLYMFYVVATPATANAQGDPLCISGACITTGPQLATIDSTQSELLNGLLGNLLGADLNLTVGDWQALAQGTVALDDLLGQLQLDLAVATPEELLTTDITEQQLLEALRDLLATQNNTLGVAAIDQLLTDVETLTGTIQLGDLLDLDLGNGEVSTSNLDLLDLVTGSIQLFNHDNILTTPQPIVITGSELGLDGILNEISLQAQVLEAPTYICGGVDAKFYSAAIRLKISVDLIDTDLLVDDLRNTVDGLLSVLLDVDLKAAVGQIDIYAAVGRGEGTITMLNGATGALTATATPGVVDIYVGQINDADFFSRTRVLAPETDLQFGVIGTLAVTVTNAIATLTEVTVNIEARTYGEGESPSAASLSFTEPYPKTQVVTTNAQFVDNLVNGLLTNLEVRLSGSLGNLLDPLVNTTILPAVDDLVNDTLSPLLKPLLEDIVDPLLEGLGVGLGKMNVTVNLAYTVCADGDDDGDGIPNMDEDPNNNGNPTDDDTDNDGTPNYQDPDDDDDTVPTKDEDPNNNGNPQDDDTDNDGKPNYLDTDDDGDTVPTKDEDPNNNGNPQDDDTDSDGTPNYLDADDDGDTVPTKNEDPNNNGNPQDDDSDFDGKPNYLDTDDDNDTVPTIDEDPNNNGNPMDDNTDGDGLPNYLDTDDDGDNVLTKNEDPNNNGNPQDDDSDNDGIADYLDPDSFGNIREATQVQYLPLILVRTK